MRSPFRSASLHTKLMLAIGLLVALVAGIAGWVVVDHERQRRMVELENRATRIADLYSQSLAQALWNVDRASIDRLLLAQSPNPELAQLKVTAANYGTVSELLKLPGDLASGVVRVRPIEFTSLPGAAPQKIGEVRLVLTRAVAEKAIVDARRAIVALGAGMVALLYVLTFVLLRRMVREPVGRLEETVDRIAGGDLDARCAVDAGDELGRLGMRVNAMADRLGDSTQRLLDSEAKFRGIVENALEGIFRLDREGRLLEANPAMAELTGHATAAEPLAAAPPFTREQVDELFATLARDGQIAGMELQLTRSDGSTRWVQLNARGQGGSGRDAPALEGFVSDLTARKQAEADRLALRDAEAASRAKTEFLAFMSHELRTPLNGVLGYAQLLRREPQLTPRQQQGLATIQASGEHLLSLINDLLDLAKIEVGKLELSPGPMALNNLLATVSAIVRVKADEKQLDFRCEADPGLPPMVQADEHRLRQVLLNLLSNAIKFTDAGSVCLQVSPAGRLEGAVRLRFEVRDSGVGMDDAQLARLFVAFEQVGDPRRRAAGTGLGLWVSQRLVGLMGSRILAQSTPGVGSRFWFELDLEVAAGEAPSKLTPDQGATGYAGPRRRILVAEDVDASRAMLVDLLRPFGFIVDEAADGQQALDAASRAWPDLVLMDIKMPNLSGIEAVRALRRMPPPQGAATPPVIMLSASGTRIDYVAAQGAGAEDILHKPVDHRRLLERMGELLKLEWTFAHVSPPAPAPTAAPAAALAAPPRDELARLLALARGGNMRRISEHMQSLAAADARYGPLAEKVQKLAASYQSRTILELVESMVAADNVAS